MRVLALFAAGLVWLMALGYYRARLRRAGVGSSLMFFLLLLRGLALGILLILLFRPALTRRFEKERPLFLIAVVDDSASMGLPGEDLGRPRFDEAWEFLFQDGLAGEARSRGFEPLVFSLSEGISLSAEKVIEPTASITDLTSRIRWAEGYARNLDVGALVMLTDGGHTTDADPIRAAVELSFPLYTVGFGPRREVLDLAVVDLYAPPSVHAEEEFEVRAVVRSQGGHEGPLEGEFRMDGITIRTVSAHVAPDRQNVVFSATAEARMPGTMELEFVLAPLENELILENNRRTRIVEVEKARFSVLFISGRASWDTRFLRRAIQEEERLHGTYVFPRPVGGTVILRDFPDGESPGPEKTTEVIEEDNPDAVMDLIDRSDLVILQDFPFRRFSPNVAGKLQTWLEAGNRSLLFLGGRGSFAAGDYGISSIGDLLPVMLEEGMDVVNGEFVPSVPDEPSGLFPYRPLHDFPFGELPPLPSLHRFGGLRPGAEVLIRVGTVGGAMEPGLVVQRRGMGYSAALAWFSTWRWAVMGGRPADLSRFWQTLCLFFLTGEGTGPIALHAAGEVFEIGRPAKLWMHLSPTLVAGEMPARVRVEVTDEKGNTRPIFLYRSPGEKNLYEGEFEAREPGFFRARIELGGLTAERSLRVEAESAELAFLSRNDSLLAQMATAGGGEYLPAPDVRGLMDQIPFVPRTEIVEQKEFLGRFPGVALALILLFSGEWLARRRHSLP